MKIIAATGILKERKGFAIVLVAALAGLIFLLGASLVVMSQMQGAASQYDQRLRLARDNARASLEMALGDLQRYAGRDKVVTYTSDVYRTKTTDDFNAPTAAESIVNQTFWTAAYDGTTETWLVTRPLSSVATALAKPQNSTTDYVTLVGSATATATDQATHDVRVPKEKLIVPGVIGYNSVAKKTIGHYAYWVGDMGVKASYAVYNQNNSVTHDYYSGASSDFRRRLEQMRMSQPSINSYDPSLSTLAIDQFVSDFQIREKSGFGSNWTILESLTDLEVKEGFHDFSGLSKGLLANTAAGGLKLDLSGNHLLGDPAYDNDMRHYANLPVSMPPSPSSVSDLAKTYDVVPANGDLPAIHPVLTQFHLKASLWVDYGSGAGEANNGTFKIAYSMGFELWNPYTSSLSQGRKIRAVVRGLPHLSIKLTDITLESSDDAMFDVKLYDSGNIALPVYEIAASSIWSPGEIRVYSGGDPAVDLLEEPPSPSSSGAYWDTGYTHTFVRTLDGDSPAIAFRFTNPSDTSKLQNAAIEVDLYEVVSQTEKHLLATYSLDSLSYSADHDFPISSLFGSPSFGFYWELGDSSLSSESYDPMNPTISANDLSPLFTANSTTGTNVADNFKSGNSRLLGFEPSGVLGTDHSYRIPLIEIPRQELTSVSMLRSVKESGVGGIRIGEPASSHNHYFDEAFFSTVFRPATAPAGVVPVYTLPNSLYEVSGTTDMGDLQYLDSAISNSAQNIIVHGAFNINSTSIQAWAAMLKGADISSWPYVDPAGSEGESSLNASATYQFFNYPQSAEETYSGTYDNTNFIEGSTSVTYGEKQQFYRRGLISLTGPEIDELARYIVYTIRERIQDKIADVEAGKGPFISINDFLNSGILKRAIASRDQGLPISTKFNRPSQSFSQRTIMNSIAPYISARSDTFVIRAYGDSVNPANGTEVWSRAYCEAIVQRVHAKHATDNEDGDGKPDTSDPMAPTSIGDGEFGRQFEVVAFRWLNPSDI